MKQVPSDRLQIVYDSIVSTIFPGAVVRSAQIDGVDDVGSNLVMSFDIEGGAWGRRTSTGFAVPATVKTLALAAEYASLEARAFPMLVDLEGIVRDRITLRVPEGLEISELPPDSYLDTFFGRYRASARVEEGALVLERIVDIPPQRIETLDYADFRVFARQIEAAERQEIQMTVSSPAIK